MIDRLNLIVDGFVPYLLERGRIRKQKAFKRNRVASKKQRGRAAVLDRAASGVGAAGSAEKVVSHRNPHASLEEEEEQEVAGIVGGGNIEAVLATGKPARTITYVGKEARQDTIVCIVRVICVTSLLT